MNAAIFREISKAFEYILKYYDLHKRQIEQLQFENHPMGMDDEENNIEN